VADGTVAHRGRPPRSGTSSGYGEPGSTRRPRPWPGRTCAAAMSAADAAERDRRAFPPAVRASSGPIRVSA